MRRLASFLFALGLSLPAPAASLAWGDGKPDLDEERQPWEEIQAGLPPAPKAEALRPFSVDAVPGNRYFIDENSLSVGVDGVIRYTVSIRSQAGAETVNYEGMRCATGERKIYAFGRPDGSWSPNRHARWERFPKNLQTGYHRELFYGYFCADGGGVPSIERIRHWLKTGGYR